MFLYGTRSIPYSVPVGTIRQSYESQHEHGFKHLALGSELSISASAMMVLYRCAYALGTLTPPNYRLN